MAFITVVGERGVNTGAKDVKMTFADGEHTVPAWMVGCMGGATLFENLGFKEEAKKVTFVEFKQEFWRAHEAHRLEQVRQQILKAHLTRR